MNPYFYFFILFVLCGCVISYTLEYIHKNRRKNYKNGLIILFGESFRLGGQGNRNRGDDRSYNEQINAANTHIKLIKHLKKKNMNVKVSINSYTTKFDNSLDEIYKSVLLDSKYYGTLIGQTKLIHNCVDRIDNINDYDFILCMRIDLCLKDKMIDIFDPHSDKILFPYITHRKSGIHPRVSDMMMYIPKKYFNLIKKLHLNHHTWRELVDSHKLNYKDLDTFLNTHHDSDSAKEYNSIYYIVNRPQCKRNILK